MRSLPVRRAISWNIQTTLYLMPVSSVWSRSHSGRDLGLAVPAEDLVLVGDGADLEADQRVRDLERRCGDEALLRARLVRARDSGRSAGSKQDERAAHAEGIEVLLPIGSRDDVGGGGGEAREQCHERGDEAIHGQPRGRCRASTVPADSGGIRAPARSIRAAGRPSGSVPISSWKISVLGATMAVSSNGTPSPFMMASKVACVSEMRRVPVFSSQYSYL